MNMIQKELDKYIESNQHFLLYCKLHYLHSNDIVEDLKIILSEHCGVFVEHLLIDSIYRKMVNIFIDLADEKTKDMFLYKLFEGNYSPQVKDNISKKFIIERLVGQISILQCQNRSDGKTITLPEPNYDKFPMFKIEVEDGTS